MRFQASGIKFQDDCAGLICTARIAAFAFGLVCGIYDESRRRKIVRGQEKLMPETCSLMPRIFGSTSEDPP